jgi:predicted N-acetyltransferase YhbS
MQSAPNFRYDLTIVAVAPDGDYVSFCGIWPVLQNGYSMVEPVASDPTYRRMGLGKAAVLEAIRRTAALGVDVAWVGSNQPFYQALGFKKVYEDPAWIKKDLPGFAP